MRLIDHFILGIKLGLSFYRGKLPDCVFIGFPLMKLFLSLTKSKNIKYIIDVKDKWPEYFTTFQKMDLLFS